MFPFTGHVTNKKWPLNEGRRTPLLITNEYVLYSHSSKLKESDIKPTTLPIYYLLYVFTAGVRAAPGAAAASRPHQPREHSPAPRGRAEAGTHYTYTIPYLQHFIFHIYSTISISTPYLQYYIYTISTALYLPYPGWPRSHSRSSCFPSSSSPAASPQQLQLFSVRLRAGDIKFNIKEKSGR